MKTSKLIHGVGINDSDYVTHRYEVSKQNGKRKQKLIWICPFYSVWVGMIGRGYSNKIKTKQPAYRDTFVCDHWHSFMNFKYWMEQQDWQGKQLDKDILILGNKEYKPDACVFVTGRVNSFMIDCGASRGIHPVGVYYDKSKKAKRYAAMCRDIDSRQRNLGRFYTPEEAHRAWLAFKLSVAYELASQITDERVAKAIIDRYKNYKIEQTSHLDALCA